MIPGMVGAATPSGRTMDLKGDAVEFSQPIRQIFMMLAVLILISVAGVVLGTQIRTVFLANPYLNGFIGGVFVIGVLATFWQVAQLITATNWLRNLQAGIKGHEITTPPRLVASMAPILREGRVKKRLAASTTRSILDSIAVRLDEARDITRYIANLLIFLGLLGTFWGLAQTVPAVVDTIRSLAPEAGDVSDASVFERLMLGLEDQLGGMGTAFASSLLGLAGSLVVGLLELFAGHGQNRFYRELEEWLTSFTRLGLVSEGEGTDGALVALLERVDEGLEKTTESAQRAEAARLDAETRLALAADAISNMASQIEREHAVLNGMMEELRTGRDAAASRDHAMLTALKRIETAASESSGNAQTLAETISKSLSERPADAGDTETRTHLRNLDKQVRLLADDLAVGRHESTSALRTELRALIELIDARTGGQSGVG